MSGIIRALDKDTINKIAAGEIIISPINCIKELIENSIDAGATKIDLLIQNNGFKMIKIQDNGDGIEKSNFSLLCKRFCTSKISTYDDLKSIATFGFRGEALSSICTISNLKMITKYKDDVIAYEVEYDERGDVVNKKPQAANQGTTFIINDLFYNVPTRLKSLNYTKQELKKIVDCISKYAINNQGISFSLKRVEDNKMLYSCKENSTLTDRIRLLINTSISKFLINLDNVTDEDLGLMKCEGIITNLSYCNESTQFKKTSVSSNKMMVFFINNRLIDCEILKKTIIQTYNAFLPKTATKPFIYLSLFIKPENVDVNVHPTKKEVYFINDEEICELICDKIKGILQSQDTSRTFEDNTKLTQPFQPQSNLITDSFNYRSKTEEYLPHLVNLPNEYRNESKLVRIDASQSNLSFKPLRYTTLNTSSTGSIMSEESLKSIEANECQSLESVKNLKLEIDNMAYPELIKFFSNSKYVGIIDSEKRICAIQCELGLYMLDYGSICNVMFYQLALRNIGAFGIYKIDSAEEITVKKLLEKVNITEKNELNDIIATLDGMKEMFKDYFGIEFESIDNDLVIRTLPMIIQEYTPSKEKLPLLVYRLAKRVNYEDERQCLEGILKQIALWYVPAIIPTDLEDQILDLNNVLENVIFPILKSKIFLPTKDLIPDINEIATLPGLYKIFERC